MYPQIQFARPPGATELFLVRHGESEAAVEGRNFALVDGQGDPALAPQGQDQARKVCDRLATEGVEAIYVSSLRRTQETAAPLATRLGLTTTVDPDLREVFLGEWEGGLFRQKIVEQDPIAVRMATEQRWDVIPKAERAEAFSRRVREAVERIAGAHPDQRVVAFSHGGTIGEILAQATGARPFAFSGSNNASISQIVVTPDRWILRRFNDTAHLEQGMTAGPTPLT
jgi:2,3-bisphosphoglycerate-dependent phosphoglycerate mutase